MVVGIPITGTLYLVARMCAAVKEPSPPITINPSISLSIIVLTAFFCPDSL